MATKAINQLIRKHGLNITVDNLIVKAYIHEAKSSQIKRTTRDKPYLDTKLILTKKKIDLNSLLVVNGENYRVFEITDEVWHKNRYQYCETKLFKDTFINDISFHKSSNSMQGCNLPNPIGVSYYETKGDIRTKNHNDIIGYSSRGVKIPPTHIITVMYNEWIGNQDEIKWLDRKFEIIHTENVDEKDVILIIDVVEVL